MSRNLKEIVFGSQLEGIFNEYKKYTRYSNIVLIYNRYYNILYNSYYKIQIKILFGFFIRSNINRILVLLIFFHKNIHD